MTHFFLQYQFEITHIYLYTHTHTHTHTHQRNSISLMEIRERSHLLFWQKIAAVITQETSTLRVETSSWTSFLPKIRPGYIEDIQQRLIMIRNIYSGNEKLKWKELRALYSKFWWQRCQILMKQHDMANKCRIGLGLVTYWVIQDKLLNFSSNSVSSSGKWRREPCLCWSPVHLQFLLCKTAVKIKHSNAHMWNVCCTETKEVVIIITYINDNKFCSYRKKKMVPVISESRKNWPRKSYYVW